jgi:hypothetical protein
VILVGDLILAETLQGFREDHDFSLARETLSRFAQTEMATFNLLNKALITTASCEKKVSRCENHRLPYRNILYRRKAFFAAP